MQYLELALVVVEIEKTKSNMYYVFNCGGGTSKRNFTLSDKNL